MGPLVDGQVVNVLVGRAGVVDLVEDHAVEVAGGFRHRVLLVHQVQDRLVVVEHLQHRDGQQPAVREEGHLVHSHGPVRHADLQIPGGQAHVRLLPLEHVPLVLGVLLPGVLVPQEADGPLGDVAVEPDLVDIHCLAEIQGELVPGCALVDRGGKGQGAQVQEGDDGVDEGERPQQELVQLQQLFALPLLEEAQYLKFRRGVLLHFFRPSSMMA